MWKIPLRKICTRRRETAPQFLSHPSIPAGIAVLLLRISDGTLPLSYSFGKKGYSMSNQIGDRYTCSDPNCGCEVEIERPCNMHAASTRPGTASSEVDATEFHGATKSSGGENISTVGDFGSQGASGAGLYGTTGSGRSATTSGRYDSTTSIPNEPRHISGEPTQERSLTCFCGSRMRLSTQSSRAANAR